MNSIDQFIRKAIDRQVGTVVHVGAGRGAVIAQYERLAPSKVILVEGDPNTAVELRRAARARSWATVVVAAAAAKDGVVAWNQYNLAKLNGPLAADALAGSYPRLRRERIGSVRGISLSSLMGSALEGNAASDPAALVLDVPGQEEALLDSLPDDLYGVSAVILRRFALPSSETALPLEILERMRERSFELVDYQDDEEPLWPVAVFRFDQKHRDRAIHAREVKALKCDLEQLRADTEKLVEESAIEMGHLRNALEEQRAKVGELQQLTEQAQSREIMFQNRGLEFEAMLTATRKECADLIAELVNSRESGRPSIVDESLSHSSQEALSKASPQTCGQRATMGDVVPAGELDAKITALTEGIAKLQNELIRSREILKDVVKKEALNGMRQLEAFANVQAALAGGMPLPQMHGWPISPDLAACLVELIRVNDYDAVIEFGSGTSTILIARLLDRMAQQRGDRPAVIQVAFEHIESHRNQTLLQLRTNGLDEAVAVHHAPLQSYVSKSGHAYPYYACGDILKAIGDDPSNVIARVLILVDGPPASTGEHARYPALPMATIAFPRAALDILLDDFARCDEKQVAQMWRDELIETGREFVVKNFDFEKEACLIRVANEIVS